MADCGRRAAETVGGIAIANEVMQPTQDLMQRLPLLSCEAGAGSSPRLLWQIITSGWAAVSAAAWAATKLAMNPANAIA
jgi:hypothetical protein